MMTSILGWLFAERPVFVLINSSKVDYAMKMILESVKKSVTRVYSWSGQYIMCYYGWKRQRAELKSCYNLKERVRLVISQYNYS